MLITIEQTLILVQHWYSINRHQEKINAAEIRPNQVTGSNQFGWMSRIAGYFTGALFVLVLAFQCGQLILWPTVWKESRYCCQTSAGKTNLILENITTTVRTVSTESNCKTYGVCATPLTLLIFEFIFGALALVFLFVETPINGYPIRIHSLRDNDIDDNELYLMTSSSRFKTQAKL